MLDVNTLPKRYRKVEEFVNFDVFSVEIAIEKERKKEGNKIFQNKCVSSQKGRIKKRRGRYRSGYTYLLPTNSAGCLVRAGRAAFFHGNLHLQRESSINYLKCPTFDANRNAGVSDKYKDADESEKAD